MRILRSQSKFIKFIRLKKKKKTKTKIKKKTKKNFIRERIVVLWTRNLTIIMRINKMIFLFRIWLEVKIYFWLIFFNFFLGLKKKYLSEKEEISYFEDSKDLSINRLKREYTRRKNKSFNLSRNNETDKSLNKSNNNESFDINNKITAKLNNFSNKTEKKVTKFSKDISPKSKLFIYLFICLFIYIRNYYSKIKWKFFYNK